MSNVSTAETTNILVVDDNQNNRVGLQGLFQEYFEDVSFSEADSGLSALSFLIKHKVDLIILDIQMPQMDGFETAKIVQSRKKTQHIPIVFLTAAYKSEEFKKKGYDLGAVDYLTKPIDTLQFVQKIRAYLRIIQQGQQRSNDGLESKADVQEHGEGEGASQSETKQDVDDIKQIETLLRELRHSFNAIIGYNKVLEDKLTSLGCSVCLPDVDKIGKESKQLLDLVDNVLLPKIKRTKI